MTERERRRPGRKPLDPTDPSVPVMFRIPSKQYDAVYARAARERLTVAEHIRRRLRDDEPPKK